MKTENQIQESETDFPLVPPEVHFLAERYIVRLPITDKHFKSPWELRLHIAKVLERHLGDEVQLTSMKVKKPRFVRKGWAKIRKEVPYARAYVTVKF